MHEAIGHGFEPHGVHINSNVFFFQVLLHLVVRINSNAFFFQMLLHLVPGATTGTKYKSIYTGRYRLPLKCPVRPVHIPFFSSCARTKADETDRW